TRITDLFVFAHGEGVERRRANRANPCKPVILLDARRSARASLAPLRDPLQQLQHRGRGMTLSGLLDRGGELIGELLPELDAPLVEGVDPPHYTLCEHAVLIERDELSERRGVQFLEKDDGARPAARVDLVGDERLDARWRQALTCELG